MYWLGKHRSYSVKIAKPTTPAYNSAAMQNDAPLKTAQSCGSMAELRVAIDSLDARLVALLAVRQTYIERAAQLKTGRDQVRDPARIEDVVAKVIAEGRKAGLSPDIAEPVWRALIEASIAHEFEAFDKR
jgi:isochorismate pyruvate lyase